MLEPVCAHWFTTHSDCDVHGAIVGFPIRFNGHHSDPDRLSRTVGGFVHLNEGGDAFGVEVQLRCVRENLNIVDVTSDVQEVTTTVVELTLLNLQWTTFCSGRAGYM